MVYRLLNLLTAPSLLLCVAVIALWVRSYCVWDALEKSRPEMCSAVELRSGELVWTHTDWAKVAFAIVEDSGECGWHYRQEPTPMPALSKRFRREGSPPGWFNFAEFLFRRQSDATDDPPSSVVAFPMWRSGPAAPVAATGSRQRTV